LQRRSITALVQEFWKENSCELLGTTSNYINNNEDVSAHNGTQVSQLTNTDGKSTELDQRCLKEDKLIEYNEIVQYSMSTTSDSSDTDTSDMEQVTPRRTNANNTSNKFAMLEDLDIDTTETDTETTDEEFEMRDCSNTDRRESRIRELEQIKCDNDTKILSMESEIRGLERSLNHCRTDLETKKQQLKLSEQNVISLKNQINARSTEQVRKADKTPIDDAIQRHFYRVLNDTIDAEVDYRYKAQRNFISSLAFIGEEEEKVKFRIKTIKEIFSKSHEAELVRQLMNLYFKESLVPKSSIRKVNEVEEFNFELYLEKGLAKRVRACARERGIID